MNDAKEYGQINSVMHIGFDISQTGSGKAGCGYFAHAMIDAMLAQSPENLYSLYPSVGDFYFDARMPLMNPYTGRDVRYGPRHLSRESSRIFWDDDHLDVALENPDIVHSNNFWCPTKLVSGRLIYTFYDMGFAIDPEWTTAANRVGCFEGVFRSAIAADWVVAISEASKAHYLSVFPHFPHERIRVVYPCSRFLDATLEGKRPKALADLAAGRYWLNVGTIEPRKNQHMLAEAYAAYLAGGGERMPLVLAGGKGWLMEDFQRHLEVLGVVDDVVLTGYVSDEELIWLYRNCYANLYPSLFEGFGLPVLEGMQFGAPTVTSNSSSLPEVAGDAAILLAPQDRQGWTQTLLQLAANPAQRNDLARRAPIQAATFDWTESAAALLALYRDAVAMPKREHTS